MDIINNLVFTALNNVGGFNALTQNFFDLPLSLNPSPPVRNRGTSFSYDLNVLEDFCALDDPGFIENAIQKHWADMVARPVAAKPAYMDAGGQVLTAFTSVDANNSVVRTPLYHLIYAFLIENTRAVQIFERLIFTYQHDENLKKATGSVVNRIAFQWIQNTETLFFKHLANSSYRNIISSLRPSSDATRRNAYHRLLGMDLGFGDGNTDTAVDFYKARANNQSFIMLFERFLIEVWQAYTNARNQVGANTTDMFSIVNTAQKLQEMLMSRRTTDADFSNHRYSNLAKEEYASVVLTSWLYFVLSYNSPLIEFLRCNGNTPGERLKNIANKLETESVIESKSRVRLQAHSKSDALLDMAVPMNTLLRRIELGDYNLELPVRRIIESQTPSMAGVATPADRDALNDLLLIINNWENATGHRIKNPEGNVTGTVKVQPSTNGIHRTPALN